MSRIKKLNSRKTSSFRKNIALHVRLGLFKNFIKSLKPDSLPIERLHQLFPKLSDAKIKAGVFTGPDIKKLSIDAEFQRLLSPDESLSSVSKNFLGKF